MLHFSLLGFELAAFLSFVFAQTPGSFVDGGDTKVSAMMMFVGNSEKVYILDKAESNAAQIGGHPAWAAAWDINTHQTTLMDVQTNVFCASGMHLPNGSFVTFGGNSAVGPHDTKGSQLDSNGDGVWDSVLQDYDGRKSIGLLNPCSSSDNFGSSNCQWFNDPSVLSMQKLRWYSAAEALADGTIAIVGGFVNGGYINRNYPNLDPVYEGGGAEPTYEFFPSNGQDPQIMKLMVKTSGLNSYAHTYLMPSGLMFVQANISTTLWNYTTNVETPLTDIPKNIARVYPASGGVAMLPLTPANNYVPTILFCGGSDMNSDQWGDYVSPAIDTWNYPASKDCQRITPEPTDGSSPVYVQDDDMLEGRTMGQFIILPNGKLFMVNGALNGTAGYGYSTGTTPVGSMPFGMSFAAGPIGTPSIYDPNAPAGQRWSNEGLQTSNIPRLYHSSAILLPDASVLIAGSNPNVDVNTTAFFPTTYKAEIFYPLYFSATTRPRPQGVPTTISYGGDPFDITIPSNSYSGSGNDAASNTTVVIIRPGFTTHAMNMGQRYLQLNNTFTVNNDSSITLHVSQAPPNANLFTPGPAMLFVNINGVPSNATMVIVGNGQMGQQPTAPAGVLPDSVPLSAAAGSAGGSTTSGGADTNREAGGAVSHKVAIIGGAVGALVVLGILGALFGICISRRRAASQQPAAVYASARAGGAHAGTTMVHSARGSDGSAFEPLRQGNHSGTWNGSTASLHSPYGDSGGLGEKMAGSSKEFEPVSHSSQVKFS